MADPTKYVPGYSYTGFQESAPTTPLPADEVDNDLAEISNSIDEIVEAVKNVRRSDGALKNAIVTPDSLSASAKSWIAAQVATGADLSDVDSATAGAAKVLAVGPDGGIVRANLFAQNVLDFGTDDTGDGVEDDLATFVAAKTANRLVFIPKPSVAYSFSDDIDTNANAWLPDPSMTWTQLTDAGKFDLSRGFFGELLEGANIWRLADRVFVGQAASKFAGNSSISDEGTSTWSDNTETAGFMAINAQFLSMVGGVSGAGGNGGGYAVVGLARNSDALGAAVIGVGGGVINDQASGVAWGIYSDLQHENGAASYGLEVAAKNKSSDNLTITPYQQTFGVFGTWLIGGGDPAYGGPSINPSNAAVVILKHDAADYGWNRGIVIGADAITGNDGSVGSSTNAVAIAMARRHGIQWYAPDGEQGGLLLSTVTDGDNKVTAQFIDNGFNIVGSNGKQFFRANFTASGVNYVSVASGTTGNPGIVTVLGDDADIDMQLSPKGSGRLRFGTRTAIGSETLTGYITIKDEGGTTRKLAVVS